MIMTRLIAGLLALMLGGLFAAEAGAQALEVLPGGCGTATYPNNVPFLTVDSSGHLCGALAGSYFNNVPGSVLTRPSNTTAYAANETVCANTSVTVCAPGTIALGNIPGGKGEIQRITLLKSGSSVTNATFIVWLFSAAPGTSSPSQFDATAYPGPRIADMPNYIGSASCAVSAATSDTSAGVWYECALSNPNTSGALPFQAVTGTNTIYYLLSVTQAYTPASAETFSPFVSGFY